MKWVLSLARSTIFVASLFIVLVGAAVSSTLWALQLSSTVAVMSANAAATAIKHRKEITNVVAKTKAKARLRRYIVAIPAVGLAATAYFEKRDYEDWLDDNPGKTSGDYTCEVAHLSAEVIEEVIIEFDDVLTDLPSWLHPEPDTVLGWMPECTNFANTSTVGVVE
jgi:hypothetical protein